MQALRLSRSLYLHRSLPRIQISRQLTPITTSGGFSTTASRYAKKGKKGNSGNSNSGKDKQPTAEADLSSLADAQEIKKELKQLENKFKDTIEQFKIKSSEAKQGKASTSKIGQMRIALSSDEQPQELRSIANIQIKNNNRTIVLTVFDPRHVKYIQSGVLAEIGVTPQIDARNAQVINITLPTRTADAKKELAKQIKQEFEHFKNSPSKHSLTYIREDMMKHIKKSHNGKSITDDEFRGFNQNVEKLFKKYSDDLNNDFKKAEKSVLHD